MPQPQEHELKCWPEFYSAIERGEKTFELRKDDRGFRPGDVLWLREWRRLRIVDGVAEGEYTGRDMRRAVSYVMSGFGLETGFVCMALASCSSSLACPCGFGDEPWHWPRNGICKPGEEKRVKPDGAGAQMKEQQTEFCGSVHEETGAECELLPDHAQNHRGQFDNGIAQWPRQREATPGGGAPPREDTWLRNLKGAVRDLVSQQAPRASRHHLLAAIDEAVRRLEATPTAPTD